MNDCKKLIEVLRFAEQLGDSPPMNRFGVLLDKAIVKAAADTIEQLAKERDELFFMVTNDMVPRRMFEQVVKQRDEAIADLKEICVERYWPAACDYCNKHGKQVCKHCDWEWRGVTE